MMTFFRRAFGFSPDSEEEEEDYDPSVPTYAAGENRVAPTCRETNTLSSVTPASPAGQAPEKDGSGEVAGSLPENLFDAVIEIFNEAQPDFVKKCLDTEAQRRYIIDSIDCKLREQAEQAMRSSAEKWEEEKSKLQSRISELEGDDNAIARLRRENSRLQLSVDRQKRALLDRINDLESQVARQAEEKERYYSRRKPTELESELNQAKTRIEELEASVATAEQQAKEAETSAKADDGKDEIIQERERKIAELTSECEKLREEVARQSTLREQLEVKTAMSDTMINDLRNQAASSRRELEDLRQEQVRAVEQIQKDLDGFEALKARKDAKIAELQESNSSLRRTIETNLYNQANSEMRLRKEIKTLRAELENVTKNAVTAASVTEITSGDSGSAVERPDADKDAVGKTTEKSISRRRGRPRKVRIDSELDNTDWFSGGKHDDPDFGYHEPPRKPVNDNEAQLSLF